MDIKSNLQLISEAAATDIKINTRAAVELDSVKESYNRIPTSEGYCLTEASDVIVNNINGSYYVEMVNLSPFMLDSGLTSISTALNLVAEANGLAPKSVGLVIDSQEYVNSILSSADYKSRSTGNYKIRENAVAKIEKNIAIANKLMSEGYKVCKKGDKKDKNEVCKKCGKAKAKCKCDDRKDSKKECGTGNIGRAVISEKKECGAGCKKESSIFDVSSPDQLLEVMYGHSIEDIQYLGESEIVSLTEAFSIKSKEDIDKRLDALDSKNPNANDVWQAYKSLIGQILSVTGYFAAAVGGIAASTGPIGLSASIAIPLAAYLAVQCFTRIGKAPGSISDNISYAKKIKKDFEKGISKFEKSGDKKMVEKCKAARDKVDKRLAELEKAAKNKDIHYQNMHDEKGKRVESESTLYDDSSFLNEAINELYPSTESFDSLVENFYGDIDLENISESEFMAIFEAKVYKTKQEIENQLKKLDDKPETSEKVVGIFVDWLKGALGGAVASNVLTTTAASIAGGGLMKGSVGAVAAGATLGAITPIIVLAGTIATVCCTKIFRLRGSISDKKVKCNRILKSLEKSLDKYKKSGDKKMQNACEESIKKVKDKIADLEKKSEGRSTIDQNINSESYFF